MCIRDSSKIEQNKTAKPLTRATEAKVNRGVYDLTVTLKAVSYTHLDVYKRQALCCG